MDQKQHCEQTQKNQSSEAPDENVSSKRLFVTVNRGPRDYPPVYIDGEVVGKASLPGFYHVKTTNGTICVYFQQIEPLRRTAPSAQTKGINMSNNERIVALEKLDKQLSEINTSLEDVRIGMRSANIQAYGILELTDALHLLLLVHRNVLVQLVKAQNEQRKTTTPIPPSGV